AAAAVLSYRGSGRGGGGGVSFDEAEQLQVAIATQNAERYAQQPSGTTSVVGGVRSISGGGVGRGGESTVWQEGGAVRVGGPVRMPQKIYDVPPVMPEAARQAGIRGVVILELTI